MFTTSKPIRFGYKTWTICSADIPLGSKFVNKMINIITEYSDPQKHELYFDNFFTS